jgi:CheY-like chemotaxis protein
MMDYDHPVTNNGGPNCLAGVRVLVAEDSPDNQFLISHFLKPSGAVVSFASDGQQAVEMVQSGTFDIILMDVQMPRLDGYSATRKIRELGYTGPILALSAHDPREEKRRSQEAGCNTNLSKPIKAAHLIQTIQRYIMIDDGTGHPVGEAN